MIRLQTPRVLRNRYADWDWNVAYQDGPSKVTYRLIHVTDRPLFVKLGDPSVMPMLRDEYDRMEWACALLPVPAPVDAGHTNDVGWLVTEAIEGEDATAAQLHTDPGGIVELLAVGLRRFHAAPAAGCPFDFTLEPALAHVERRMEQGLIDPVGDFHPEHEHLTVQDAWRRLQIDRPVTEDTVVCHGDYCLPNVILANQDVRGFVDVGELGVADRWWDLAVATWSIEWNLGPGFEARFLRRYGVEPDSDRMAYYRLLYDLVS